MPIIPPKFAPSHGGSEPPSNTWYLGPTQVLNPNGISIGSAVFAGLTNVTDRQTDHATQSLTIDRIYVPSTAMRSNNNNKSGNISETVQDRKTCYYKPLTGSDAWHIK